MSKIMYKARAYWRPEVIKVTVAGETAKSVKLGAGGRLERKETKDEAYFDTFDQAKAWLLEIFEARAMAARRRLEN